MGRSAEERAEAIIALYAARTREELRTALDVAVASIGEVALLGSVLLPGERAQMLVWSNLSPAVSQAIAQNFGTAETNPLVEHLFDARVGEVLERRRLLADQHYLGSPLYNEVFAPLGLRHRALSCLARRGGTIAPLGILEPTARPIAADELPVLQQVVQHGARALDLVLQLEELEEAHRLRDSLVDDLPYGLLRTDRKLRLLAANAPAEAILRSLASVSLEGARIRLRDEEMHARLLALVRDVIAWQGGRIKLPAPRAVAHRLAFDGIVVTALPGVASAGPGEAETLLLKIRAEIALEPAALLLRAQFSLTRSESLVAALLAQGQSLAEIAGRLGVGLGTVRTHTKRILEKSGTTRQAAFVALALSLLL